MTKKPVRITVRKIAPGHPGFYVCIGGMPVKNTIGAFRSNQEFGLKLAAQKYASELREKRLTASDIKLLVGYPSTRGYIDE